MRTLADREATSCVRRRFFARVPRASDSTAPIHACELVLWQLNRIIDHIEQHLTERITGKELAQLVGVSIGQLFRAFKLSVGLPPQHYVVARRLQFACSLLRTSREPLSQIALTAGFCDQAHFCRVFRRVLGVTPAAWRQINATGPGRTRVQIASRRSKPIQLSFCRVLLGAWPWLLPRQPRRLSCEPTIL